MDWPGVAPQALAEFQHQLSEDFQSTVARFLALQTRGSPYAQRDRRTLTEVVLSQPMPTLKALKQGLEILRSTDLQVSISSLRLPFLRIYGYLDGLVPRKVAAKMDLMPSEQGMGGSSSCKCAFYFSIPLTWAEVVLAFTQGSNSVFREKVCATKSKT